MPLQHACEPSGPKWAVILGFVAAGFTSTAMGFQLVHTIRHPKLTRGLSTIFLVWYLIGYSLWLTYAIKRKIKPVIISVSVAASLLLTTLVYKLVVEAKFKRQKQHTGKLRMMAAAASPAPQ